MEPITPKPGELYTSRYGEGKFRVVAIIQLEQKVNAYTYEWVDAVQFTNGWTTYVTTVRRFLSQYECVHNVEVTSR